MGVLFPNSDITIYHFDKTTQKYTRYNIQDVNMNSKRNSTVSDNGVNIFYTTMIVAPIGDYKATTGDKVIKGNITLDINKISDLKDYEVLTVVGIQSNNIFNTVNIECK